MPNGLYFRFYDDNKIKYTYSHNHHKRMCGLKTTTPYIAWNTCIIEIIDLILDTYSTGSTLLRCEFAKIKLYSRLLLECSSKMMKPNGTESYNMLNHESRKGSALWWTIRCCGKSFTLGQYMLPSYKIDKKGPLIINVLFHTSYGWMTQHPKAFIWLYNTVWWIIWRSSRAQLTKWCFMVTMTDAREDGSVKHIEARIPFIGWDRSHVA